MQQRNTLQVPKIKGAELGPRFRKARSAKTDQVEPCEESLIFSTMHSAVAHFFPAVAPASRQAKAIFNLRIKKLKCIFGNFTNIRKALLKEKQKSKVATNFSRQEPRDFSSMEFLKKPNASAHSASPYAAASWDEGTRLVNELLVGRETNPTKTVESGDLEQSGSGPAGELLDHPNAIYPQEPCCSASDPAMQWSGSEKQQSQSRRSLHAARRQRTSSGRFFGSRPSIMRPNRWFWPRPPPTQARCLKALAKTTGIC